MKDKEISNTKKMVIILIVTLVGMVLGVMIATVFKQPFLFDENERFMDYFNTLKVSDSVYESVGTGRGYFPFTYILLNIIQFLIRVSTANYYTTVALVCLFLFVFYDVFFKGGEFWGMLLITFFNCSGSATIHVS